MSRLEIVNGLDARIHNLVATDFSATPFQTLEWQQNWINHFGKARSIKTILGFQGNDLVCALPLYQSPSFWSAMRIVGTGPSDYLFPLSTDQDFESIHEGLKIISRQSLVDLHQIPSDHPFSHHSEIEQATCLTLDLPTTFEEYVQGLSKSLRYDVRRINGKALSEKNTSVEWVTSETVDQFADAFFELHKLRWKSRGLPGAFFGKSEQFQREWMHISAKKGWLWMSLLIADGKPVGSVYAMNFKKTCYFYQAGMDPTASNLSPGTILVAQTIKRAIEEGCTTFDFMRGDEPYKRRWKPTGERKNHRILMDSSSVLPSVGQKWNKAAWRVECIVRDRVEGKSLKPKKQTP